MANQTTTAAPVAIVEGKPHRSAPLSRTNVKNEKNGLRGPWVRALISTAMAMSTTWTTMRG